LLGSWNWSRCWRSGWRGNIWRSDIWRSWRDWCNRNCGSDVKVGCGAGVAFIAKHFMDGINHVFNADLGLHEIAVRTKVLATSALVIARKGGHHDNFNLSSFWLGAQNIKHVKAGDFRHHDIRNNKIWFFLNGECESLLTIAGGNNIVTLGGQPNAVDFSQGLFVLDQHNFAHTSLIL
jgi:hypothetical protein